MTTHPIASFLIVLGLVGCAAPAEEAAASNEQNLDPATASDTSGPGNGACADAAGSVAYTISRYEGGAVPMEGMVIGERKLVLNGEVVGHTQHRYRDGSVDVQPWTVDIAFVGPRTVLERSGGPDAGAEVYAQKIEAGAVHTFVICRDHWNHLLP
jgi:hypothetical protein